MSQLRKSSRTASQSTLALCASFGEVAALRAATYQEASSPAGVGCLDVALAAKPESGVGPPALANPCFRWPETCLCSPRMKGIGARFVYILRSESDPSRHYVGRTGDVEERLRWHNEGPCGYTVAHRPGYPSWLLGFQTKPQQRASSAI